MQYVGMSKGEFRVVDAAPELRWGEAAGVQFVDDLEGEVEAVLRAGVGEAPLGALPDALVRVEFGCIRGKELEKETGDSLTKGLDRLAPVHPKSVPDHDHGLAEMVEELAEEGDDLDLGDVVVVPLVIETEPSAVRADGDPRDDRDPVVALPVPETRRLATGRPGTGDRGRQPEARFVDEDEVGAQPKRVFFTWGQRTRFHRSIAASSRSRARRSGFWQLQPHWPRSRPTWSR